MSGFTQPIVLARHSQSGQDEFHQPTYTETLTVVLGAFAPGGSTETSNSSDTVTDTPTVYLTPGSDVTAVDAVIVGATLDSGGVPVAGTGLRYNVDGDPRVWMSPYSSRTAGVEVRLRKSTG